MPLELVNGFGHVYLTIEYDAANHWVYNNWLGIQTYIGIIAGADACLHPLREHQCAYLLNDNRHVLGPWDHAVEWIAKDWAPRASAQGLTHFAQVISPEALAATSGEAMHVGIGNQLQIRQFSAIEEAQAWLRQAQNKQ
ncbi:hypothetical protein [Hymenobacter norwichensis]|uniref:hypothetical protein n=1 Tax=Hymenobacter norwichensis TaxID=223903 RepID=UPI0003B7A84E|nr:hypothetical protein [Hymenobacter norwichensis]